jgi:two-component system cell cycle response regulator
VSARILVIEDNPMNMDLMTYLLKSFGHMILTREEGTGAVEFIRNERPDLVICDVQLPGLDGYEIARQLKANEGLSGIPLIAVTAYAMVGDRDNLLASGFDGYISKPIEPSSFVSQVQEFLRPEQRQAYPTPFGVSSYSEPVRDPGIRGKVLVVDDSAVNLSLMRTLLEPSGYEVRTADSVKTAMMIARQFMPGLIVADVHMPGQSGYELAQSVSEDPELRSIPCILISSTGSDLEARNRPASVGAKLFILRPIEPLQLLAEIERHIIQRVIK